MRQQKNDEQQRRKLACAEPILFIFFPMLPDAPYDKQISLIVFQLSAARLFAATTFWFFVSRTVTDPKQRNPYQTIL